MAHAVKRPCWTVAPAWLLTLFLGRMAEELLLNGVAVRPKKLIDAGFEFIYPTLEEVFKKTFVLDKK